MSVPDHSELRVVMAREHTFCHRVQLRHHSGHDALSSLAVLSAACELEDKPTVCILVERVLVVQLFERAQLRVKIRQVIDALVLFRRTFGGQTNACEARGVKSHLDIMLSFQHLRHDVAEFVEVGERACVNVKVFLRDGFRR